MTNTKHAGIDGLRDGCWREGLRLGDFVYAPRSRRGNEHRTLRLRLKKHTIMQEEYDQAVQGKERTKAEEEYRVKEACTTTKSGLQFNLGSSAELDFIDDNSLPFRVG